MLSGAAGDLQLQVDTPTTVDARQPVVLLCHPHPLYGGSLQNKVVHMLARGYNDNGLTTVRFNFRGVGKSAGVFDHGEGEGDDLHTIANYLRQTIDRIWLAGFSFGAYVAARAYEAIQAERLLLVAPSVTLYDMSAINNIHIPWSVIQGSDDEVIAPTAVKAWLALQRRPPRLHWLEGAGHFFHGRLNELREIVHQDRP
ncbi:MAG: alpha/beta hydrolase [Gammaproteobacteria bacterium]